MHLQLQLIFFFFFLLYFNEGWIFLNFILLFMDVFHYA